MNVPVPTANGADADTASASPRRRRTEVWRPVVATLFCLLFIAVPTAHAGAAASTDDDPPMTTVVVSDEPGVCSNQGSLCERLYDWTGSEGFAETTSWLLGTPLRIVSVVAFAFLLNRLARRSIRKIAERVARLNLPEAFVSDRMAERSQQRADAVGAMLRSSASTVIFGTAGIVTLDLLGVSVVPIIASLGIAGIAIGFGAQHLVEDLISGVMLIIEDQLGVGDRVDVGVVEGDVERLTLRSTVILARNGVRWYVPNSAIRQVANESQHKGRASVRIGVSYAADLQAVATTFREAIEELATEPPWSEAGVEDIRQPFVAELTPSEVVIELRAFVEPVHRRPFERALRQRLVDVGVAAGIEFPNDQLDIWVRTPADDGAPISS